MSELNTQLAQMVNAGAVLQVEGLRVVLAHAEVVGNRLFWVRMFPNDQSDAHGTGFASAEVFNDRDIGFRRPDGAFAAYVTPFTEWPDALEGLESQAASWAKYLSEPKNSTNFSEFVEGERRILLEDL